MNIPIDSLPAKSKSSSLICSASQSTRQRKQSRKESENEFMGSCHHTANKTLSRHRVACSLQMNMLKIQKHVRQTHDTNEKLQQKVFHLLFSVRSACALRLQTHQSANRYSMSGTK